VSPAYLPLGENIRLPFQYCHTPPPPRDQLTHKAQIAERLVHFQTIIPRLGSAHYKYAMNKDSGRKVLVRPAKYQIGELVLIRNYKRNQNISSPFDTQWIGPYRIHSLGDKGIYRIQTVPKPGKRPGLLKNWLNWSRIRRILPAGDDEFFIREEGENGKAAEIADGKGGDGKAVATKRTFKTKVSFIFY